MPTWNSSFTIAPEAYATPFGSLNASKNYSSFSIVRQPYWIATLSANCIIILSNIWIVVAFVRFSKEALKGRRIAPHNRVVYKAMIVAVTVPFTRYFSTLALLLVMIHPSNASCEAVIDIGKSFFVVSLVSIYMFYWIRQRSFYRNSALSHILGRGIRSASKFSLIQLLLMGFVMIPLTIYPNEYEAYSGGCRAKGGHSVMNGRYFAYAAFLFVAQITVLSLFSYPLIIHFKVQRRLKAQEAGCPRSQSRCINETASHPPSAISSEDILALDFAFASTANDEELQKIENNRSDCFSKISANDAHEEPVEFLPGQPKYYTTSMTQHHRNVSSPQAHSAVECRNKAWRLTVSRFTSMEKGDKLFNLISRTFKLSALAVVSDMVTVVVVSSCLPEATPQCVIRIIYDFDLHINIIAVIAGFDNWIGILKKPCTQWG